MKNAKKQEPLREENHFVKATFIFSNSEMINVPCKIYLPERTYEKPYMVLKPSKVDTYRLASAHKAALKAVIYGFDKEIQTTIEAPEVHFSGCSTKHWGHEISESTVHGVPQDLHVIHHLQNHEGQEKTLLVFWVSPNTFLTPYMICSTSYTGDIKYEKVGDLKFTLKNNVGLVFDKYFDSKSVKNGDLTQWSYLVACVELDVPADDVLTLKKTLQDIDDFLLIASFAARFRTACLGWTATDKKSHATFYRGNYTFPDGKDNNSDEGLVDIQDFERFTDVCYSSFLKYENKLALRNALYSAVPSDPNMIETTYLQTFAGLEMLILDFRKWKNLEFILPETEWACLKKYLQSCIKKSTKPKLERGERAFIYCKLDELNRVSLREVFDVFCTHYEIDLSDLWPVFGEKRIVGLTDIRNRLIHGDPFPLDLYRALIIAKEHLKYTLERVIARVLGWNIEQSRISNHYLSIYGFAAKDLSFEQTRLSEFIYRER